MANRAAPALGLRAGDRAELVRLTRSSSVRAGLAQRARIVLLAADGVSNTAIADRVGVSRPTVIGWRERYQASGMVGLVDEKSQIQALDRTAPILPLQPGLAERRSHDYLRHGTSTLFAALEIATGNVTGAVKPRHRHQEFVAFLKQVDRAYPDHGAGTELHLVMDNYAAHKHPKVQAWLAANPRVICHFTPTHASWMNLVEVWFSLIERQAIHRGTFGSVRDLNAKIRAYIDGWNDRRHPFVWTKTADQILNKANRKQTSNAGH